MVSDYPGQHLALPHCPWYVQMKSKGLPYIGVPDPFPLDFVKASTQSGWLRGIV